MKLSASIFALCALSVSAFSQNAGVVNNTGHGLQLDTRPDQGLSFYGAAQVVQPSGASQAALGSVTGSVTAASLQQFVFTGKSSAGAITLTGAPLGATVVGVANLSTPATASSSFEATISVAGQIQQSSSSDLSASKFLVTLATNSATDLTSIKTLLNALQSALKLEGLIKGGN